MIKNRLAIRVLADKPIRIFKPGRIKISPLPIRSTRAPVALDCQSRAYPVSNLPLLKSGSSVSVSSYILMSTTGDVEVPPVDMTVPAEAKPSEKPKKEKKAKTPKEPKEKKRTNRKTASHPPYFQMIKEALLALNEKNGSSPYAVAKYMEEKHKAVLPANFKKILTLQLKNSVARGKLIKIKASYKLSEPVKKANAEKKLKSATINAENSQPAKKSERPKRAAKPANKVGMKKTRKATSTKPKQPRSIKSPAAKRAKKAAAA